MPIVRTAVLLFAYPAGQQLNLKGDAFWYRNYFFGPSYGQAGYWIKQTDAQLVIDGTVIDWAIVNDPNPVLTDRTKTINFAIAAMESDRGIDFGSFDVIVLVLGVPRNVATDGGSTTAKSEDRSHAGVVIRAGDPFDFVAHELGHAMGLQHSFGSPQFKSASWTLPGEYGHPHCIMSARSYGGIGRPHFPSPPRDGRPEYSALGPSLNAASALGRGWLDAHVHQLPGAQADFELRSRHWLGGGAQMTTRQALELRAPDGKSYVLEYRENMDWDAGLAAPALIVNGARGSTADAAHPNNHSATFLGSVTLPISFGATASVYNGPGFCVQILDRSPWSHTLRIRVRPGSVGPTPVQLTSKKDTLTNTPVATGQTRFEPGEVLCVEGSWTHTKWERTEVATFEATYALAVGPITAVWSVDGQVLPASSDHVWLAAKQVRIANPKLLLQSGTQSVRLRYEIEPIAQGSRLRLFNRSSDEKYDLDVGATLTTKAGSGDGESWVQFEGIEYLYPQAFYERRDACLERFRDINDRFAKSKVLLPHELWKRVPERLIEPVERILVELSHLHDRREAAAYAAVVERLAALIGVAHLTPSIVDRDARAELVHQIVEREPEEPPARLPGLNREQ